jgi:hypothetical protein
MRLDQTQHFRSVGHLSCPEIVFSLLPSRRGGGAHVGQRLGDTVRMPGGLRIMVRWNPGHTAGHRAGAADARCLLDDADGLTRHRRRQRSGKRSRARSDDHDIDNVRFRRVVGFAGRGRVGIGQVKILPCRFGCRNALDGPALRAA